MNNNTTYSDVLSYPEGQMSEIRGRRELEFFEIQGPGSDRGYDGILSTRPCPSR